MSVQFGRWNLDGRPTDPHYLEAVGAALSPYGPDGKGSYVNKSLSIICYAFYTTRESRCEAQPHVCASGAVITWDGRLDNRTDLISELRDSLTVSSTDLAIVAVAYQKWGTNCFGKLIGDWAVSIWHPSEHSLILAKDPIGARHLYYVFGRDKIEWSSVLDPLVRFAGKTFELNEEYIAGWLSMFPAAHLTPYVDVHSVPPSHFVLLRPEKREVNKYWDFDPGKQIRYRTDAQYEEHFRGVFDTAVRRRLRSDTPVLAELSGGRDSSSIVCTADEIIARSAAETPRLDTLSYFDDDEPNWDEKPYFTAVEKKRGRTGRHIDVGLRIAEKEHEFNPRYTTLTPGDGGRCTGPVRMCLEEQGNRVVLSGIGGDEMMGGVPTPIPELQDSLSRARFGKIALQLKVWALEKRKPWIHLLCEAGRGFFPPKLVGVPQYIRPAPWLESNFTKRQWDALTGYPTRSKLFGSLPSFQENMNTVDTLRRQIAHTALPFEPTFEKRYPYLDRGLLEFVFAIPRDQLVRPKQRRSLMRRALTGIVPDEILNKKGKAFVVRSPLIRIATNWDTLVEMSQHLVSGSLGIVDPRGFADALRSARRGEELPTVRLMRTISLENWIRSLTSSAIVDLSETCRQTSRGSLRHNNEDRKVKHAHIEGIVEL